MISLPRVRKDDRNPRGLRTELVQLLEECLQFTEFSINEVVTLQVNIIVTDLFNESLGSVCTHFHVDSARKRRRGGGGRSGRERHPGPTKHWVQPSQKGGPNPDPTSGMWEGDVKMESMECREVRSSCKKEAFSRIIMKISYPSVLNFGLESDDLIESMCWFLRLSSSAVDARRLKTLALLHAFLIELYVAWLFCIDPPLPKKLLT